MTKKKKVLKRIGIIAACLVGAYLLIEFLLIPLGMGVYSSIRVSGKPGGPPEGFQSVEFTAADDVKLAGWYSPSSNDAAILLLHGSQGSRESVRAHAQMLAKNGFGVLAIDMRGNGESGGTANAYGWECGKDVRAGVDFLKSQGINKIGGMGLSLGGEVLLGEAYNCPEMTAIVSDGATFHTPDDYVALDSRKDFIRGAPTNLTFAFTSLFTGQTAPKTSIPDSISGVPSTQFLFIAAGSKAAESEYGDAFVKAAAGRGEMWVAPDAGHTGAYAMYPGEYESRVIDFYLWALEIQRKC